MAGFQVLPGKLEPPTLLNMTSMKDKNEEPL